MNHLEQIQSETLSVLSKLLIPGQHVALLDFPNHENSGDSLIYLGQLEYLKRLGVHVDYVADHSRYNPEHLRTLVPHGPILINGGGNFGDRWQAIQAGRERIISDFPDRDIIQMPSSIDFRDGELLERAQRVLNAHPSLTLLIRDHAGVKRTRELFPNANVIFCPDAAFGVGPIRADKSSTVDMVILRRADSESLCSERPFSAHPTTSRIDTDWGLRGHRKAGRVLLQLPGALVKRVPQAGLVAYPLLRRCYDAQARLNVNQAVTILSRGMTVATDRLHATVLASLMGKPVIAMDNSNGKVSAICSDYLGRMPGVTFAPSVAEAEREADLLTDYS